MAKTTNFFKIMAVIVLTFCFSICANAKKNTVTNNNFVNCPGDGTASCYYTPVNISADEMTNYIKDVKSAVGKTEGTRFIDKHHNKRGDKTKVEPVGSRVKFYSSAKKCTMGVEGESNYKTNVLCKDLIEYWLIEFDKAKLPLKRRLFQTTVIIYELDTRSESGIKLGFSGLYDESISSSNTTGTLTDSSSVHNTRSGLANFLNSLTSVVTLDRKSSGNGILSIKMSLGNIGGYMSTYKKFSPLPMPANKYFSSEPLREIIFSRVVTTSPDENSKEATGLSLSGEIETINGVKDRVLFRRGKINYASATNGTSNNPDAYSLTRQINLGGHATFELEVELNKPKLLFDISTVELQKEKGFGFLFFNDVKVKKHVNLMGVLYVEEVTRESEDRQGTKGSRDVSQFNITDYVNEKSLSIDYEPIITAVGLNTPDDIKANKKESRADFEYKIKPYYMKLEESKLPADYEEYLNTRLRVYTSPNSLVNIMGGGRATIKLRDLIDKGLYFGVEPKKGIKKVPIDPLGFEMIISVDRNSVKRKRHWSNPSVNNAAEFYVDHYYIDSDVNIEDKRPIRIPWK